MSRISPFQNQPGSQTELSAEQARWRRHLVIKRLKETYLRERASYARAIGQPVPCRPIHEKYERYWEPVADLVISLGCDPEAFMRAQWRNGFGLPYPHRLANSLAASTYRWHEKSREEAVRASFNQFQQLRPHVWDRYSGLKISGHVGDIPPAIYGVSKDFMRLMTGYCLGNAIEDPSQCKRYFEPAAYEYLTTRQLYDKVWGDAIPESIRLAVDQYIAKVEAA